MIVRIVVCALCGMVVVCHSKIHTVIEKSYLKSGHQLKMHIYAHNNMYIAHSVHVNLCSVILGERV